MAALMNRSVQKSPSEADRYIGSRIRARRTLIGVSQEKLGDALGVTFQQVQKYERGVNRIGAGRLQEIGTILGVSVGYFYEGISGTIGLRSQDDHAAEALSTPLGQRLAKAFAAVQEDDMRRKIVELVEAIVLSRS
ncbi:helix-turn-helix domain-containing protein [Microvirga sp. 2MCAF38]|uniref:helix-turn-helix domain-containing protein n=1 Tax=Microvirga sp. 2MCAF38 TaxID=3232989 RepID=UPI003F9A1BA5